MTCGEQPLPAPLSLSFSFKELKVNFRKQFFTAPMSGINTQQQDGGF
jgi:hypothetical protein